jgi:hypothetical protein
MKKYSCLLLIVVFLASCQKLKDYFPKPEPKPEPLPQFNKVYGGSQREEATSIIRTKDDGYLFTGSAESTDGDVSGKAVGYDAWVVKLNKSGGIQWQKPLGGKSFEQMLAAAQTKDDGYIVAGYTYSNDGDVSGKHGRGNTTDAWVVKLNASGTIQWQKALGGSGYDIAYAITTSSDGGYVVAGYTDSENGDVHNTHGLEEVWIVKLDDSGNIQWQKTLGGSDNDRAYGIAATADGGYVIAAGTGSTDGDIQNNKGGVEDAWIIKVDGEGKILWQTTLGGRLWDEVRAVTTTKEGDYLFAGFTEGDSGFSDAWVIKFDQAGHMLWQKTFGGSSSDGASSIAASPDGGFAIAGYTESSDGDVSGYHGGGYSDAWVVKADNTGAIEWQKALGGTEQEAGAGIVRTRGGFAMAGWTRSQDGDISGSHGDNEAWVVTFEDE